VTGGQAGQSLNLSFIVLDSSCLPVNGARVDIWYANADGIYSGVENQGDDFGAGKDSGNFLRGTQFTDSDGLVTFKGIYPGWYPSRTIHIHEKIWIGENEALTTQTYFSDDQNASVMSKAPYSSRGNQRVTNSQDMLIQRGLDLEAALMQFDGTKASFTFVLGS
jgi:protocatechuate 3,4-dioxygenase beta subunit